LCCEKIINTDYLDLIGRFLCQ